MTVAYNFSTDTGGNLPVVPKGLLVTGTGVNANDTPIAATDVGSYRSGSLSLVAAGNVGNNVTDIQFSNDNSNWFSAPVYVVGSAGSGGGWLQGGSSQFTTKFVTFPVLGRYCRAIITGGNLSNQVTATAWFSAAPFAAVGSIAISSGLAGVTVPFNIAASDSLNANNSANLQTTAAPHRYNPATSSWERVRNNNDLTLLASTARTTTTASADQTHYNGAGRVRVVLNVTAASGTGGLQVVLEGKDSISGNYYQLNATPTAVTAMGLTVYDINPGGGTAANGVTQVTQTFVPRTWRARVLHGDGSSYSYSLSAVTMCG